MALYRLILVCHIVKVWGISKTRDQNYCSNARPRLRLANLSYNCVAVLSDRNSIIGLSFLPLSADLIDLFSDEFGPRGEKLNSKQTKFSGKNHQIEPSSDKNLYFFSYHFHINFIIDLWPKF